MSRRKEEKSKESEYVRLLERAKMNANRKSCRTKPKTKGVKIPNRPPSSGKKIKFAAYIGPCDVITPIIKKMKTLH